MLIKALHETYSKQLGEVKLLLQISLCIKGLVKCFDIDIQYCIYSISVEK